MKKTKQKTKTKISRNPETLVLWCNTIYFIRYTFSVKKQSVKNSHIFSKRLEFNTDQTVECPYTDGIPTFFNTKPGIFTDFWTVFKILEL